MTKLLYESLIEGLLEKDYCILDNAFSDQMIELLRDRAISIYENEEFRLAGVGDRFNFTKARSIRSDQIHWLEKTDLQGAENDFMNWVGEFVEVLNYSCFAGIVDYNFHFAIYENGSFYKRHSDQFHLQDERRFSMVLYLSESWKEGDGGELVIYKTINSKEEGIIVQPKPARLVFFNSELEHEVIASNQLRISLTGWMRRRALP